jgi:phage head maturation protease
MESIRRGDVTGSSFMFWPRGNTYRDDDRKYIVERNDVQLLDCGPVTLPAYKSTDASMRSAREAIIREIEEAKKLRGGSITAIKARAQAVAVMLAS